MPTLQYVPQRSEHPVVFLFISSPTLSNSQTFSRTHTSHSFIVKKHKQQTNEFHNSIKIKIVLLSKCVYSDCLKRLEGTRRAWPALRQLFLVQVENFNRNSTVAGTNSRGWGDKREESLWILWDCGKQWPSATLCWHRRSPCGLPTKQQQREKAAKTIICVWDQYVYASVCGGLEVWSSGEAKNHHPSNAFKLQKKNSSLQFCYSLSFSTISKR